MKILKEEMELQLSDDNCGPGNQAPSDEEHMVPEVAVELRKVVSRVALI